MLCREGRLNERIKLTDFPNAVDEELLTNLIEAAFKDATGVGFFATIVDVNPGKCSDDITINVFPKTPDESDANLQKY